MADSGKDYHINVFWSDGDGQYVADIPDLVHCSSFGATPEEALAEVLIAKRAWLEAATEAGKALPRPQYRGAFQCLAPKSSGDLAIAGRGLRVYTILGEYEMGMSAEAIAENAEIPLAAVYEALVYAAEHPEEMEAITRADDEVDRRLTARLPEHLRQMAEETRVRDEKDRKELVRKVKKGEEGSS